MAVVEAQPLPQAGPGLHVLLLQRWPFWSQQGWPWSGLQLLPNPPPCPVEAGSSGNPQIQKLGNLALLFTSSGLPRPSLSGPQDPRHGVDVVPQLASLLDSRGERCRAGQAAAHRHGAASTTERRCAHLRPSPHPPPCVASMSGLRVSYWCKGIREKCGSGGQRPRVRENAGHPRRREFADSGTCGA